MIKAFFDLTFKFILNVHLLLVIIFSIFYFVPGSYVDDEHFVEQVNQLVPVQKYFFFSLKESLVDFYTLDFGVTLHNKNLKVTELIWNKAVFSFQYLGTAVGILLVVSIVISFLVVRSRERSRYLDVLRVINQIPQLVMIPLIIYLFSYLFNVVPLTFDPYSTACHVFVIATLLIKPLGQLIQLTVEKWHKENSEMYVQFARAKGLSRNRVLVIHMFKNIANSFLGYFLTIVLQLLTGNFILESLYSVPGFGLGFMDSVSQRDLPVVIGYLFLFSSLYLTLHFAVQTIYLYINPRLRDLA